MLLKRSLRSSHTGARSLLRAIPAHSRSYSQTHDVKPLSSVLIANRGEIALRVGKTAAQYGIKATTLYTDPDARSQHALSSPFAINLGDPSAYLDGDRIIQAAQEHHCDSIHPGYGFLSENAGFAKKCTEAGLKFIGPPWEAIEAMGSKSRSKEIMTAAGVPCIPGYHGPNQDPAHLLAEAEKIGFPVLLKAVMGGGGKGMRISRSADDFDAQLDSARTEARNSCGDDTMLVEKYITSPRHIEVQVFADAHGNCVALGERDCSVQRRHQKIIEESPAPQLPDAARRELWAKARAAALAVGYEGAGTVEFIFDNASGAFFFMEMNTRLQVEHPVTELVTGQDLVRWQLLVAEGHALPLMQDEIEAEMSARGHAFEARIYAENPGAGFMPDSGPLLHLRTPAGARVDAGFAQGDEVSPHYDPMIAKLIVGGADRRTALLKLRAALADYEVAGMATNIEFLKRLCDSADFQAGIVETGYIAQHRDELFAEQTLAPEIFVQAALGILLQEQQHQAQSAAQTLGFGSDSAYATRTIDLSIPPADPSAPVPPPTPVTITQTGARTFNASADGSTFTAIEATPTSPTALRAFYRHTRLDSTLVRSGDDVTLFMRGAQHRLRLAMPGWAAAALGTAEVANSVRAPMPCKVLRVEVAEGERVVANQALVVVESMKMETVIRSPGEGVVERVVHKAGDICKAGTALVEFAAEE